MERGTSRQRKERRRRRRRRGSVWGVDEWGGEGGGEAREERGSDVSTTALPLLPLHNEGSRVRLLSPLFPFPFPLALSFSFSLSCDVFGAHIPPPSPLSPSIPLSISLSLSLYFMLDILLFNQFIPNRRIK
jgi:hypothetical protein